jgi:hypothetical protein
MRRLRSPGGRKLMRRRSSGVIAAAALTLAAGAPAPVFGADRTPTPSGKELREAYPLDPSGNAARKSTTAPERSAATPTPAPIRRSDQAAATAQRRDADRPATEDDGGSAPWLVSGLLAALVAAAVTAMVVRRRRSGAPGPEPAPRKDEPATPVLAVFGPPDPPTTAPARDTNQPADRQAAVLPRRDPAARRANGVAAEPASAVTAAAGARARRGAAAGPAPAQGGRSLAVAASRFRPAAGPEPVPEPPAGGGGSSQPPRASDPEPEAASPRTTGRPGAPVPGLWERDARQERAVQEQAGTQREAPAPRERASAPAPPDPEVRWTAAVEWRATDRQPRFAVLATADEGSETIEIATSEPVRWPPAGPDDVAALNAVVAGLEQALLGAGWSALAPGDAWYAKRFAWAPAKASGPERQAPPATPLPAVNPPGQFRRGETAGPAARRTGPPRQSLAAQPQPQPQARGRRPGPPARPAPAAGEAVEESGAGRFVRRRPWPEETDNLWRCEIKWDAGYKTSRFTATMRRPGARRGQVVAASEPFKWMLMAEPTEDGAEYRAALDALVRALRTAGWERIDSGSEWWAERFVWRGDEPPPEHVEAEPVRTDSVDSRP